MSEVERLRAHGLPSEGAQHEEQIQIFDQIDMPEYNPSANSGRGDWGLRNVSDGTVMTHPTDIVRCVEHGAMNSVSPNRAIWRCLMCGRSAYRDIAGDAALEAAGVASQEVIDDAADEQDDLRLHMLAAQPACLNCDEPVAESVDGVGLRAERDAALEAIERVRALHRPTMPGYGPKACVHDGRAWPCPTVSALDGAPEPEGRWEYRGRLQSCGYVAEGYISAEYAMNGLRVELEDHPYLAMDDTAIVERARVREWLPVERECRDD